ncbi:hypothetical protein ACFSJW_19895 [Flavobacterium artemisiae]
MSLNDWNSNHFNYLIMFKKISKTKEVKKFVAQDVQKLTVKELKQTMGGYQEPILCYDEFRNRYYPC